jgi:hypothetical protein
MRTRPSDDQCGFAAGAVLRRGPCLPGAPAGIDRLVARAAREVQVLAALTPVEARLERARLIAQVRAGRPAQPSWRYAPVSHSALRSALEAAEAELAGRCAASPLEALYLERLRELCLEAALCEAAGTSAVAPLARVRYAAGDGRVQQVASQLSSTWIAESASAPDGAPLLSDSNHPSSLLSRMQAAVGSHRLPFRVACHPSLASLAATGEHTVYVASGRLVHDEDAVRTVLHEVEGHALPRARALQNGHTLFRAGTARGIDDQEGRALLLEERAGLLTARRRRQLAARHTAVEGMLEGGTFSDIAFALVRSHGLQPEEAVVVSERAFRGGDGVAAGLGRERVYLESYVRVGEHLSEHPEDDAVLASGQIAAEAAPLLRGAAQGAGTASFG